MNPEPSAPAPTTLRELLAEPLSKDRTILGARVDGRVVDLHTPVAVGAATRVEPIRTTDPDGLAIIRHSTAHVMADAVQRLFPGTKVTIGPATAQGFYYDFDKPGGPFTDEDLSRIEAVMREIIGSRAPFRREVVSREEAHRLFAGMGESYKRELIDAIPEGEEISLYRHGAWVDLCEGPHVPSTEFLQAVKLVSVAGAYWRGDERNPMLQRIYGTAFPSEEALTLHLQLLEEAKQRDHRKLGRELELFQFHEYAPAMPFLLPRGAAVYNRLVQYVRDLYIRYGYEEVITPQIFDTRLFETSGHLPNYRENMFLGVTADVLDAVRAKVAEELSPPAGAPPRGPEAVRRAIDEHLRGLMRLGVKPMNCPGHCLVFGQRRRSYRELPWRIADFGRLHRYERGGVVHGLARVRSFAQDDAHIFCTEAQLMEEMRAFVRLQLEVYAAFRFDRVDVKLATRPEKRIGDDRQWDHAERALEEALRAEGLAFELLKGEGAFYGPKLEFHVEDALHRSWQLGTLQLDHAMPERFGLEYVGPDGAAHRPVMLHRAILGSLERFFSVFIEHTAGAFPTWIAPEQVVLVTVSEKQEGYAREAERVLAERGVRVRSDLSADKLGAKIRNARLLRVPYIGVIGDKEAAARAVAPRSRDAGDLGPMPLVAFAERVLSESVPPRPGPGSGS